ncbi:hypothetical protein BBK82_27480 [Lentzea guizhouensis]|uniref:Leucine rich repeat variant n=1 Tax=Lentzea guizhouensis TaxID=1586287 RepID=A0A1B2HNF6_9PSEU|nr:hypothetical protein [Lentzea guizhouensis]ANZ39248.1 hypothetical protein BBK82_27480 [Lentzea guizhouensis]
MNALHGLAENPSLPPDLLARLVALADQDLKWHLSRRTDLSAAQRVRCHMTLVSDDPIPDPDVLPAERPDLSPVELFHLATHENPLARLALAARRDLPPEACERLAEDPLPGVRWELAANPVTPEPVLRSLATACQETRRNLAHNPKIPLDLLADIAPTTRIGPTLVPRVATATPDELRLLAASDVPQVRALVAQRGDLPPDVLDLLATDTDLAVAKGVAPALAVSQLREVVHRHGTPVFPRAALNPNCPPDLLHHLATNAPAGHKTFREVAAHPNTSTETLLLCLHDDRGRAAAARHPSLPADVLLGLLDDPTTAEDAAANPALPVSAMRTLLGPTT